MLAQRGDQAPLEMHSNEITPFHSYEVPSIDILFYFVIICQKVGIYDEQASAILVLIERFCRTATLKGIIVVVNSYTIHR